jgi:sulfur relay (sulfurtransferase) DsrC/TusE family protein
LKLELLLKLAQDLVDGKVIDQAEKVSTPAKKVSRRKVSREKVPWQKRVLQSEHRKVYGSFEETMRLEMTEAQREVFLIVDEFWKEHNFSPSVRNIAAIRGKGVSNTQKIVRRLIKIGALKKIDGMGRTLRPTYINFRYIE